MYSISVSRFVYAYINDAEFPVSRYKREWMTMVTFLPPSQKKSMSLESRLKHSTKAKVLLCLLFLNIYMKHIGEIVLRTS